MRIADNILGLIGHTPLVRLNSLAGASKAEILVKLEYFNPGSSIKDRLAYGLVEDAESKGLLDPSRAAEQTLVEPTSGNTGIGLALVAAVRGYTLVLTMPESMSEERKALLRGLGARLVLTPAADGMTGAVAEAGKILAATPGAVMLQQFKNPAGPEVHARTTAREIWDDCDGQVDIVISAVGTGGTVTGLGRFLKSRKADVQVYAVEPAESPVLSGGKPGPHVIQGIGAGFVPAILDRSVLDGVLTVSGDTALTTARELMRREGIMCGISSGAAVAAALEIGSRPEHAGKRIVCIAPDTAERYLSTRLFTDHQ